MAVKVVMAKLASLLLFLFLASPVASAVVIRPLPTRRSPYYTPSPYRRRPPPNALPYPLNHHPSPYGPTIPHGPQIPYTIPPHRYSNPTPNRPNPPNRYKPPNRPNGRKRPDHDTPQNPNSAQPPNLPGYDTPPNTDEASPPSDPYAPPNPTTPPLTPYTPSNPAAAPTNPYVPLSPYVCPNPVVRSAHTISRKSATHYLKGRVGHGVMNISQQHRHQLESAAADASAGAIVLDISVGGTTPQILRGILDITSELVWVQCGRCPKCARFTPRGTRTFQPDASPSFSVVGCGTELCEHVVAGHQPNCNPRDDSVCRYDEVFYGDAQYTSGVLATETFTFGAMTITQVVFGCSGNITLQGLTGGASGFLGFSRGALSLVSQLNISGFSYFISHKDSSKSFFGFWIIPGCAESVHQQPTKHTRYTPLLEAMGSQNPNLYYVNLTGIQVDGQLLADVPAGTFGVQTTDGSGGVYMSTTMPVTYLDGAAYNVVRLELMSRIHSQGMTPVSVHLNDPLCYMTQSFEKIRIPRLALVFDGNDAIMYLHTENYFLPVDNGQTCLTILPSTGGSVLGSLLQAGRTMTYDIHGGWLSFD